MSGYLRRLANAVVAPPVPLRPLASSRFCVVPGEAPEMMPDVAATFDRAASAPPPTHDDGRGAEIEPTAERGTGHATGLVLGPAVQPPVNHANIRSRTRRVDAAPREAPERSLNATSATSEILLVPMRTAGEQSEARGVSAHDPASSRAEAHASMAAHTVASAGMRSERIFQQSVADESTVHVHIGRIDVRAVTGAPVPPRLPHSKKESLLDAHLRERDAGRP